MRTRAVIAVAAALVAALPTAPAEAFPLPAWSPHVAGARRYADSRAGVVAFAVVDQSGRLRGYRPSAAVPSASILKPMLLVAYLRKSSVRHRALTERERDLLGPMIRRSDNGAAGIVLALDGSAAVYRLARVAGMKHFRLRLPIWGLSEITPRDQARFFYRIDSYVPARHRTYAMRLLATIVPAQRWGVAQVVPVGWRLCFKGGWGSGTGLVDHQVALLTAGARRVSLAITTRFNPTHEYGKETLRGVAARLLRGLPRSFATPFPR
jgi:beta-lactamase family protein